jgi:hypothetical protein
MLFITSANATFANLCKPGRGTQLSIGLTGNWGGTGSKMRGSGVAVGVFIPDSLLPGPQYFAQAYASDSHGAGGFGGVGAAVTGGRGETYPGGASSSSTDFSEAMGAVGDGFGATFDGENASVALKAGLGFGAYSGHGAIRSHAVATPSGC